MQFSDLKNSLQKIDFKNNKVLLYAFLALGAVALLMQLLGGRADSRPDSAESFDVDTMIPAGYLLVPLQLSNADSLSSLTGQFAVVDLYTAGENGKRGFKVASSVKLLRAPLNPQQFAVLVRENESSKIVSHDGSFFAALKNRKEKESTPVSKPSKNPLIIHYGE